MTTVKQIWDVINEGGEGYRPDEARRVYRPVVNASAAKDMRMLRGQDGNLVPAYKLAASLEKDTARMAVITDETARRITQAAIDHARAQLGV